MTWPLDQETAWQLAEICQRLGSTSGEVRAQAAWDADRLLEEHGLTWHELLAPDYPALISFALNGAEVLSAHDCEFLQNVNRRERLTAKQIKWLLDCVDKVKTRRVAGRLAA